MEIGSRDGEAARSQGLVSIVLTNGGDSKPDFVVSELTLERAGWLVIGDVDDLIEGSGILVRFVILEVQVLGANGAARRQDDGTLHNIFKFADVSGPRVARSISMAGGSIESIGFWNTFA